VSGTSESSPVVAGVAALLRSYYPELCAKQIRDIILNSAVQHKRTKVKYTDYKGKISKTKFKKLSVTGAVINVLEAVKLAESIK
jgi:subtilisin family serine protease